MTQSATPSRPYTVDEYLRRERDSAEKHEFDDGRIIAMAGATRVQVLIASNAVAELRNRLKGKGCVPYGSDLRIRVAGRPKYVYPDVSVICGEPKADPDDRHGESFLNPRLIIEVLSPSTEKYDRNGKLDRYRGIESFREYVLVAQDSARVQLFYRQPDGTWAFDVAVGLEAMARFRSIDVEVPLSEIYAGVQFPPEPPEPGASAE
jgi:Uma2 family endonuclease